MPIKREKGEKNVEKYKVDVIAIGNGTASRESEIFIADVLKTVNYDCKYIIISEAGASVYSASKLAAEEFPEFDVMQRSAVSIARRLQDPLAELVKIDPKSIGVGQRAQEGHPHKPVLRHDGVPSNENRDAPVQVSACRSPAGVQGDTKACGAFQGNGDNSVCGLYAAPQAVCLWIVRHTGHAGAFSRCL